MLFRLILLLTFVLLSTFKFAYASLDDYVVKQWHIQHGLASQSLKNIVQDQQGYLWIGSQFGLSRFDGNRFTNFNVNNSDFLPSNAINSLLLDNEGFLWIGTDNGLVKFSPSELSFERFSLNGPVRDIAQDNNGRIWIASNSLYLYSNQKLNTISQLLGVSDTNNNFSNKRNALVKLIGEVRKMALSPDGIWLINDRFLLRLQSLANARTGKIRFEITERISLPQRLAQSVLYDMAWLEGDLFIASEVGAYFLDIDQELRPFSLPYANNATVYKFMYDSDGSLWVSTKGRLLYRDSSGVWQWIEPSDLEQTIWFSDIFRDQDDNIWLASLTEGLWQARPSQVKRHRDSKGLNQPVTTLKFGQDDQLWLATNSGIGYLDDKDKFHIEIAAAKLGGLTVHDLHFQGSRLFIATNRGAFVYDNKELRKLDAAVLRSTAVFAIETAEQGGLWLATDRGLYRLAFNGLRSFVYNSILDSKYITFINQHNGNGYLGTSRGAYFFNERGIERLAMGSALAESNISFILPVDSKLFVATQNNGLFYRNDKRVWRQLDVSSGLPYGPILSLYFDDALQHLWVSTSKGVYRLPIKQFDDGADSLQVEQVISPYNKQLDGKTSQCCSGNALGAIASIDSSLWYPSKSGLVEIPTNIRLFNESDIRPIIETVTADNGGDKNVYPVPELDTLILNTEERNLTLGYTAINYQTASNIDFRYRLVGLDGIWREANNSREANYANLPAGKFVFELQAKRPGQEWTDADTISQTLIIPKAFDETVIFRLIVVMSFILALYIVFLFYRNQERRKQEELERLVETRTQALISANEQLNKANDRLKLVSHSDELTGLRSRRFLFDQLPKDIEHFQSNRESLEIQGKCMALLILNLDKFSHVNDVFGSFAGDNCLQQIASMLTEQVLGADYVVRWSGDEFLILLRDMQKGAVHQFARSISHQLAEQEFVMPDGRKTKLTGSVGWAFYPLPLLGGQIISWETSIKIADIALQKAKAKKPGSVAYFSFSENIDAFEFEDSERITMQLEMLLETEQAKLHISEI